MRIVGQALDAFTGIGLTTLGLIGHTLSDSLFIYKVVRMKDLFATKVRVSLHASWQLRTRPS